MNNKGLRVIVVGAGIVGSSLAYHLAGQNAHVTLIDKAPQPANDVTDKSFAWITVAHDNPKNYSNLRHQAISDWHRVEREFKGQLKADWSGALTWQQNTADTARIASELLDYGYEVRLVDRQQIQLLEPGLRYIPDQAIFAENEGAIDSGHTTQLFVKAAREAGADVQLGNEVMSFITNGSRITGVVTLNGGIPADVVVLAAGAKTADLCLQLNIKLPVITSPAILLQFQNDHRFVNRIVSSPFIELRGGSGKEVLAAEDYIDESIENNPQAIAQRTLANIRKHWKDTEQLKLKNVRIGQRPMPQDGLPIIGRVNHADGLYLSVMHAGVTLAALTGRLTATEILSNKEDVLLSPYRLKRFNELMA